MFKLGKIIFVSFLFFQALSASAVTLNLEQGKLEISTKILNTSDNGRSVGNFYLDWQEVRRANTSGNDFVISGYFTADSNKVSWGDNANPEVYVKIWFANNGSLNLNFFHVGYFDIEISSRFNGNKPAIEGGTNGNSQQIRISTAGERYMRHDYNWRTNQNQNSNIASFNYTYPTVTGDLNNTMRNSMIDAQFLETMTEVFNEIFRLPEDIELVLAQCNISNAFYDPSSKNLVLCYELFADIILYAETADEVADIFIFVLFHELGHALIDVLNLPITGREEDVADQFSSYILLSGDKTGDNDGEIALITAAAFFWDTASSSAYPAYWDEHSLNEQRFYNMLCWTYGRNPERWQPIVSNGWLPYSRAVHCGEEWQQIESSWEILLSPHLK